ncbi:hypothetical protein [Acidilobus sp.]|uniref:hypothetical protein n=1 Tax=Acidilobus sp. TaxID=1872109 RepID=UPI003CFEC285
MLSREAGELPEGCKCNDYEFFATYDRLEALYLPTRLARGLSQSLVLRPSELLGFLRCGLVNSALLRKRSAASLVKHEVLSLMYTTLPYMFTFIDGVAPRGSDTPLRLRKALEAVRVRLRGEA